MNAYRAPGEYYNKFPEIPVEIKSFNPTVKKIAQKYEAKLEHTLASSNTRPVLYGSTLLEISGKGEIEFAVYPDDSAWDSVIEILTRTLGNPGFYSHDRVRYEDIQDGIEVEVCCMRGETALANQRIMQYWLENPSELKVYEELKQRYAYSKREYYHQKNEYIATILESLPN